MSVNVWNIIKQPDMEYPLQPWILKVIIIINFSIFYILFVVIFKYGIGLVFKL